jgi:hypothetical protein
MGNKSGNTTENSSCVARTQLGSHAQEHHSDLRDGDRIPASGHLEDGEPNEAYLSREPTIVETMAFPNGGSLERQRRCYRERQRSGGYAHVVALLVHSTSMLRIPYPASLRT